MKGSVHFMQSHLGFLRGWTGALAILLVWRTMAGPNAQPQSTNSKASAATNVLQSVFIMPKGKQDGVDPFFPRSNRPYFGTPLPTVPPPDPVTVAVDLKSKAISGLPEHRLALINNHTFEAGEEGEIVTTTGRMRIR